MSTRRDFLQVGSTAVFIGGRLRYLPRESVVPDNRYPRAGDPRIRDLAARALDAAVAAGATYADVRFTLMQQEDLSCGPTPSGRNDWSDHYTRNQGVVGVRVLADGAWGFQSSTLWTAEEMARLGHEAATQAQFNGKGRRHQIEWTPRPAVIGTWATPVEIDPFTVPLAEKIDVGLAWAGRVSGRYAGQHNYKRPKCGMWWSARRRETTFASTEGSFLTQTHYFLHPVVSVWFDIVCSRRLDQLQPCAKGWEVLTDPALYDDLPRLLEESYLMFESESPTPNRYDIVCDATMVAQILAQTIGVATELDRVLGYEANVGGTSYLAPPDDVLGQTLLNAPLLSVMANRSIPGMAGTTKWDDEGVEPMEYPVIDKGVVVGYHTNRELAPELAAWDAKQGRPAGSRGCAVAARAEFVPVVQPPNLVMAPAATDVTFDQMVSELESGLVMIGGRAPTIADPRIGVRELIIFPDMPIRTEQVPGNVTVDRQQLNGELKADSAYEVRKGKRVRTLNKAQVEVLFRAPDLWKNLQAVGGKSTQMDSGFLTWKGEPGQSSAFGVRACAARFKQVALTDARRKA